MKVNFGFDDMAYGARYAPTSPLTATTKKRRPKELTRHQLAYGQGKTTGEVAKELESKYKIVEKFFEIEEDYIVPLIENAVTDEYIAKMVGETPDPKIKEQLAARIVRRFRSDLTGRKFDGTIRGVPTLASLRGVSHLRQHPYAKDANPRPSFIDTGMYQRSFSVSVEED